MAMFSGTPFEGLHGKKIEVLYADGQKEAGWLAEAENGEPLRLPRSNASRGYFFREGIKSVSVLKTKVESVYDPDAFDFRVTTAVRIMMAGGPTGANCRKFDACFEMGDGDKVVLALVRRAQRNTRLMKVLPKFIASDSLENAKRDLRGEA